MRRRDWKDEVELAEQMLRLANARRRVVLSPGTAMFIAGRLMKVSAKPTRNEIAKALCDSKCPKEMAPCYGCTGKANIVVSLYGERLEQRPG